MQDTSKFTAKELHEYRVKLFRDAAAFKKPDRMFIGGNIFTWMFLDAGYSPAVASRDYALVKKTMSHIVETYKLDMVNPLVSGFRNPFLISDSLGGSQAYSDQTDTSESMNAILENVMLEDELREAADDPVRWMWKAIFRRYPKMAEMSAEEIAQASKTMLDYQHALVETNTYLREHYGVVSELNFINGGVAFEMLFNFYRGIKSISMDMRRRAADVDYYCSVVDERNYQAFKAWMDAQPYGPDMHEPYDACAGVLGHTIVNEKQFNKYLAPILEKYLTLVAEKGKQMVLYTQGSWKRFGDFFNQFKKGTVTLLVEQDDIIELREKFPNIGLLGGISVSELAYGTPDSCIAQAKHVIDTIGKDGGVILQPSKFLSYKNDCKPENLKALCEFVTSYEI